MSESILFQVLMVCIFVGFFVGAIAGTVDEKLNSRRKRKQFIARLRRYRKENNQRHAPFEIANK